MAPVVDGAEKVRFKYECFTFKQRPYSRAPRFCIFFAAAGDVLLWSDIERLGPGVQGVQRRENVAKRRQIARFLKHDKRNTIPTAVTLAFDDSAVKVTSGRPTRITIDKGKTKKGRKPALVIDGQHRLLGVSDFDRRTPLAIVGIMGADDVERAFQFLVINNKGSKVSKNHMKALALNYKDEDLAERLRVARIAIDRDRLLHVDILNRSKDSPFYRRIKFPSTPGTRKKIVPEAFERALAYIEETRLPKLEDEDIQREFFAAIWSSIANQWPDLFQEKCALTEKVGIICMTRYLVDALASRADIDELDLDLSNFETVRGEIKKLLGRQSFDFWTADWKGSGYDTAVGHVTIIDDLKQIARNLKSGVDWHTDLKAIKPQS
jgi:DGQHR domain-containing protein